MSASLKVRLEALLFATDQPLGLARLAEVLVNDERDAIEGALAELEQEYAEGPRAFRLARIAGGYQLATKPELAEVVSRLFRGKRRVRLTRAAFEALAIIAYKQPTTRPEIDAIRGVSSGGVVETLLERDLVHIAGRSEGVGRPLLYATTNAFLQYLGLNQLADLPSLAELEALLVAREQEARREEEDELRQLATLGGDEPAEPTTPAAATIAAATIAAATIADKLRQRDLPTLEEIDIELQTRAAHLEAVVGRVAAEPSAASTPAARELLDEPQDSGGAAVDSEAP